MGGQYGIDEIKKVAFFGLAFGQSVEKFTHESSALKKAVSFISCLDEGMDLLSLDRDKLKKEFAELDAEDKAQLLADCAEEFELEDKDLERKIEQSLAAGFQILDGIEAAYKVWVPGVAQQ